MKKKLLKNIKIKLEISKEKRLKEKEERKQYVEDVINKAWTIEDVRNYNNEIKVFSLGWLGSNYSEETIKEYILRSNSDLFTSYEYEDLYNKIYYKDGKIKIK